MHGRLFTRPRASRFRATSSCSSRAFIFATAIGRRLGAAHRAETPTSIVDLGLAMLARGRRRRRALLHVIADGYFWDYVHLCTDPGAGRLADRRAAECVRADYDGRVGRGEGRLPPERARTASRGRSSGPAGSPTTAASSARRSRRVYLLRARSLPVLEGRRHGGLRRPDRARLRPHGLPARGLLLRQPRRRARSRCRSRRTARRARRSSSARAR